MNIERDAGAHEALSSFLPVGRAVDAVDRLAKALLKPGSERALSITGPYGSGKSSLALLLDGLLAPRDEPVHDAARHLLQDVAPEALKRMDAAHAAMSTNAGFLRCFATAQQEPVGKTVCRALINGIDRVTPAARSPLGVLRASARTLMESKDLDARSICALVIATATEQPLVLLLDEFGKSLEAAAATGSAAGDLFLLQELAEASLRHPLAIVTLQHMGYGDYASDLSASQRRDWAKVQGRFEEINYVEGAAQTRRLIGSAFEPIIDAGLQEAVLAWASRQAAASAAHGMPDLEERTLADAWPLHPTSLAVLPELVKRYGQNERTLFSFLASSQSHAAPDWLNAAQWRPASPVPSIRLWHLYDYFVDAATSMSGFSAAASRWLEIDTRIRDARGLDDSQLRVLKSVGLLNLVAAGGDFRAGRSLLSWALVDDEPGTADSSEVLARLTELTERGLLSWRDFSDEYRVWHGSDFDIRAAVERARRQLGAIPPEALLAATLPLAPVVAGRHSHRTGTLRHFERRWVNGALSPEDLVPPGEADGLVLFATSRVQCAYDEAVPASTDKPVVSVALPRMDELVETARELAALQHVLAAAPQEDWVVRRELAERRAEARARLDLAVDERLQAAQRKPGSFSRVLKGSLHSLEGRKPLSALLSDVADDAFMMCPEVRNELINRNELSSQAAKARRELLDAMLASPQAPSIGIAGFGPERSMYESVLKAPGMHRETPDGWRLTAPHKDSSYAGVWREIVARLDAAGSERLNVEALMQHLDQPPYGVRRGLFPVLLTCVLLDMADVVAIYEHGTFKPTLTSDLLERLVRNPEHFELKHFGTRGGRRAHALTCFADALRPLVDGRTIKPSVVSVVGVMVQTLNTSPEYAKRTLTASADARAVRASVMTATEPDVLLFKHLPESLGLPEIVARRTVEQPLEELASRVAAALLELRSLYGSLLEQVADALADATGSPPERLHRNLRERAAILSGKVLDPRVSGFVKAMASELDRQEWLEYVAMVIGHTPPATWRDDEVNRFRAAVAELGETFRRVEALNTDANALRASSGFDVARVTVTTPNGKEQARLVWVEREHRPELERLLDEALTAAARVLGSEVQARDALLAVMADPGGSVSANTDAEEQGTPRDLKAAT